MIEKVSYLPNGGFLSNNFLKKDKKVQRNTSTLNNLNISKYSTENVLSYHPSFMSRKSELAQAIGQSKPNDFVGVYNVKPTDIAFEEITAITKSKLIEGNAYGNTAYNIATALGPSKNIMLVQDEEVMPEIVIHDFVRNVKDGRYNKIGLINNETEVFVLSPEFLEISPNDNYFVKVIESISSLSRENPEKQKVVFLKDFDRMLSATAEARGIENFFDRETFQRTAPNVRIVGLIPKNELKQRTDQDIINGNPAKFNPDRVKYVRRVDLEGLGANKTKEFMKKNVLFMRDVLSPYSNIWFDVDKEAIDAIVDGSAYKYGGAFPKKAYNILDMVAASMANKVKSDQSERIRIQITAKSVNDFYQKRGDLLKYLKMDDSVFSFAENVKTRLDDVGGAKDAKDEVKKIIEFAKDPARYINGSNLTNIPKGFVMAGPPGTGKTLLARATAGEAGVPFSSMSAPELLKKYVGEGEEAIREWFSKLKQAARDSGTNVAIGFIDEIDAIGKVRNSGGGGNSDATASLLNQLLIELDGFDNKDSDVHLVIMAATNRDDILDPALVRPGRFDKVINVLPPQNVMERLEVLEKHVKNLPFKNAEDKAKILSEISELMVGKSGAEIANLVNITKEVVSQRKGEKVVTYNDMFEGFLQVIQGKKTYIESTPEEKVKTVIHEAGHATMIDTLGHQKLSFISNESRGKFLGVTINEPLKGNPNFNNVIKIMSVAYGGGLAEDLASKTCHDSGVTQDYIQLTSIAEKAIKRWGLGIYTPAISFYNDDGSINKFLEDTYRDCIKKDIEIYTQLSQKISEKTIEFHKDFISGAYLKRYNDEIASGEGGNVLSGAEFKKMKQQWLKVTNREKKYDKLLAEIDKMIVEVQDFAKVQRKLQLKAKLTRFRL